MAVENVDEFHEVAGEDFKTVNRYLWNLPGKHIFSFPTSSWLKSIGLTGCDIHCGDVLMLACVVLPKLPGSCHLNQPDFVFA